MNHFRTLYFYELKKICFRKIVWITMGILIIMAIYMGVGEALSTSYSFVNGQDVITMNGFEYLAREKENAESITGQKIDDVMLQEVREAYHRSHVVSESTGEEDGFTTTVKMTTVEGNFAEESLDKREEIEKKREQYKEIYYYVNDVMGNYEALHAVNEDILYQTRLGNMHYNWTELRMTEEEKAYWMEKENTIEKPFVYGYARGWEIILEEFLSLNFMIILALAICLSNVFSAEHFRKTDQLILCSKYGKKFLYFAKMAAGVTFGVGGGGILLLAAILSTLCVYGTEGFDVAVQVHLPMCPWNLTMGQAVLLMSVVYMVASVFCSIITMFLSEAMKNSVAVMGVMTGSMIVTMLVSVPYQWRVISQIYELLPSVLLRVWQLWDGRLVRVFGGQFANFQIAPMIYMLMSVMLIRWGNRIYKNYQVSGR